MTFRLRSIELVVDDANAAADFLVDIWGMAPAEVRGSTQVGDIIGAEGKLFKTRTGPPTISSTGRGRDGRPSQLLAVEPFFVDKGLVDSQVRVEVEEV